MLILSRKLSQKLIINDNIIVTILDAGSGNVQIGIEAPPEAKIYREESIPFLYIILQKYEYT